MRARHLSCLVVLCLLCSGCASLLKPDVSAEPAALRPGQYALDPDHAALLFKIDHLGFSKFVGRFESVKASLDFDEADPTAARIEAIVDMTSLDIANDAFAATLMGPGWFDAEAFPEAVFRSTAIEVTGENRGRMTGDLTLRGATLPATFEVVFNGGGRDRLRGAYVVGFSATGRISRSAYGIDRFGALIADDAAVVIEAEFVRKQRVSP